MGITDVSGRLARWRLRLAEFDYTIEYRKGNKNQIADAISRLPTTGETGVPPDVEVPVLNIEHTFEIDEEKIQKHILEDLHDDEDLLDIYTIYQNKYNISVGKYLNLNNNAPSCECTAAINIISDKEINKSHCPDLVCPVKPATMPAVTDAEIIFAQAEDKYCQNIQNFIQNKEIKNYLINEKGIICR